MIKKIILIIAIIIFLFSLAHIPTIFQEGNPLPLISGILQLNFTDKNIVKISDQPVRFLTKSKNALESVVELMRKGDYELLDYSGSSYRFVKKDNPNSEKSTERRFYSRFYVIWHF